MGTHTVHTHCTHTHTHASVLFCPPLSYHIARFNVKMDNRLLMKESQRVGNLNVKPNKGRRRQKEKEGDSRDGKEELQMSIIHGDVASTHTENEFPI